MVVLAVAVIVVGMVAGGALVTLMWSDPARELTTWWWWMVGTFAGSLVLFCGLVLAFLAVASRRT